MSAAQSTVESASASPSASSAETTGDGSGASSTRQLRGTADASAVRIRDVAFGIIERVCVANESFYRAYDPGDIRAVYDCGELPSIPLGDYGEQISQPGRDCSRLVWLLTFTFVHRVSTLGNVVVSHHNVHRLVLCSVLLAIKFLGDRSANASLVAQVAAAGGISCAELCQMERAFLTLTSWRLYFQLSDLAGLEASLEELEGAAERSVERAQQGALKGPVLPIPAVVAQMPDGALSLAQGLPPGAELMRSIEAPPAAPGAGLPPKRGRRVARADERRVRTSPGVGRRPPRAPNRSTQAPGLGPDGLILAIPELSAPNSCPVRPSCPTGWASPRDPSPVSELPSVTETMPAEGLRPQPPAPRDTLCASPRSTPPTTAGRK